MKVELGFCHVVKDIFEAVTLSLPLLDVLHIFAISQPMTICTLLGLAVSEGGGGLPSRSL